MKYFLLIFKNLRRNLLRTSLTCSVTMFFVFKVTLVWTIVWFMDRATAEKSKDLKAIVTERWQIPSQMPWAYASSLCEGAAQTPGDVRPQDNMTWQFYGGSLEEDKSKRTRENIVFFFGMDPHKIIPMMDDAENFDPALIEKLASNKKGAIIGRERLQALKKKVGERIKVYSFNYADINLEFDIIGQCPEGRYNQSAFMNRDYLNDQMDVYKKDHRGTPHPMADKTLNLVWLRVPDTHSFELLSGQIMGSPAYQSPAVKCETASSGIAAFLDAYKDLLWFLEYIFVPAMLGIIALVVATAISISVRERRTEIAVLKVLGFQPRQIMLLVLGEALILGAGSGLLTATATYVLVDLVLGGIKFPIAFFPAFFIPINALVWGFAIGAGTALVGSAIPAWSASSVKVSEVFAKVA
jgi:putative ABC transport system permease protein